MSAWIRTAVGNWRILLAFTLLYVVIAIYGGPGFYFLTWWVVGTIYVVRVALRRY